MLHRRVSVGTAILAIAALVGAIAVMFSQTYSELDAVRQASAKREEQLVLLPARSRDATTIRRALDQLELNPEEAEYFLARSVLAKNEIAVRVILEMVPARSRIGFAGLMQAAEINSEEMTKLLLSYGAPVDMPGPVDGGPLHVAARRGCVPVARLLIEAGAEVSSKSRSFETSDSATPTEPGTPSTSMSVPSPDEETGLGGFTPLHCAVSGGHEALVTLLLEHGADPKIKDDAGETPLARARSMGYDGIAQRLREALVEVHLAGIQRE